MRKLVLLGCLALALIFLTSCTGVREFGAGLRDAIFSEEEVQPTEPPVPERESVTVVIPEGFTFLQIARRLEEHGIVSAQDFFEAAQSFQVQSFETPFSPDSAFFLEGFLFPDTYEFFREEDPDVVLRRLLNNYAARVLPLMAENNTGLSDYEILILASIIEREVRSSEHMAMVSSVLHNRLDINMRLQVCPTRYYVMDTILQSPWYEGDDVVHWLDLYNTYRFAGIPIGPICNPGIRAIYAALNPVETDYLFFFFGMDNDNHYSRTYAEHRAAMARIGVNFG